MLRVTRFLVVILLVCLSLSVLAFSQATTASVPEREVIYGATSVEWPGFVPDAGALLTISGPAGFYLRQKNPAGTWGRFNLVNEQGQTRADGVYKWELVVQAGWEGGKHATESGWFKMQNGRVVSEGISENQPVVVEEQAPASSLYVDSQGRVGLGTSVPASQLHLKGILPAVMLEDTTTGGGLFTWRGLEKGDGSLALFDKTGEARWLVDSEGRIGINTARPTSSLTVDGYIESTKGFLINGRPVGIGFGLIGGSQPLWVEGASNSFFGTNAGIAVTSGLYNSFFGVDSGSATTSGTGNTFTGWGAGKSNASGNDNSFFGAGAGLSNTASNNSFFGQNAGNQNTIGEFNCFFGKSAGEASTSGSNNSFFGAQSGSANTTGNENSFFGRRAGFTNTTGYENSFFGMAAGVANTTGYNNSFFGRSAGVANTTGYDNSFFGAAAGFSNTVEHRNTFVGFAANINPGADPATNPVTNATAIGFRAYVAQSNSLVLGSIAGVNYATSYVNVGIGTTAPARQLHLAGPNAVFRMDRPSDTAAFIMVRTDPTGVTPWKTFVVGTNATGVNTGEFIINDVGTAVGGLGNRRMTIANDGNVTFNGDVYAASFTPTSSAAFKTNIRTFENALETVNRLRGVRFDWKDSGKAAVGLIAEEVNEIVPEVVAQENGKARGVNYDNLVAVLVEAVKEQQKTIEKQQQTLQHERTTNEAQQAELDSLKAEMVRLKALVQGR